MVNSNQATVGAPGAWVPVAWYVGHGGARNIQDGAWSPAYVPNPAYNRISITSHHPVR